MQNILARNLIWSLAVWFGIFPAAWAENKQAVSRTDKKIEAGFENGEVLLSSGSRTQSVPAVVPIVEAPLSALEQRLFTDAGDGRLDEFSLLDTALIASGVKDSAELGRYEERVAIWVGKLKQERDSNSSQRRQVEAIFALMHGKILKGRYNIKCTDLRQALDEGGFNCLSATVLFNCLAGELGLSCSALETPEHVLSRVYLAEGPLDVETTCPKWFCLRNETHFNNVEHKDASPFSPQKGEAPFSFHENQISPPKKDTAKLREISPIQLTALFYYNRAIDFLAEKRFSDAAAANAKSAPARSAQQSRPGQSAGHDQ